MYSGLPTKHKIKIPMVIDAPYALTTSREHIEDSNIRWNGIVRKEMYSAIFDVMEALKEKERSGILRFVRISRQLHGSNVVYANDMFDFAYLKEYPFLSVLKSRSILPTYDPEIFVSAQSGRAMYFPEAVNELFLEGAFGDIRPGSALDINKKDYENLLTALDCQPAQVDRAMNVLEKHGPEFILENNFRAKLYEYLQTVPPEFKARIKEMAIIPVYGRKSSAVQFISWKDDSIFVKKGSTESAEDYYVLNEKYLSKAACEKIFGENINEMNAEWERGRYNETLRKTLRGSKVTELYHYLLSEFAKGAFDKKSSWDVLRGAREFIPLKNQLGQITDQELFISRLAIGHFQTELVCGLSVHPECAKFAERLQCRELRTIHFEDINYQNDLTADDIEELYYSNYFVNRDEIIRHFYNEALVSDELMEEYDLVHLIIGRSGDDELNDSIPFPEARVGDSRALNMHIQRLWRNPVYVIKVKVERTVDKGEDAHGNIMTLDSDGVRKQTMVNYTPENLRSKCFCQMCKRLKPYTLIEVNNIQKNPQFYFPQLRISLCLECSKRFEALRNNQGLREAFMKTIRQTSCFGVGKVDVPIGEETVTFTAKHLAEIQEILRQMPADQKGKS